jgi:hypothetical protein
MMQPPAKRKARNTLPHHRFITAYVMHILIDTYADAGCFIFGLVYEAGVVAYHD